MATPAPRPRAPPAPAAVHSDGHSNGHSDVRPPARTAAQLPAANTQAGEANLPVVTELHTRQVFGPFRLPGVELGNARPAGSRDVQGQPAVRVALACASQAAA
jgi:hypothetical protein